MQVGMLNFDHGFGYNLVCGHCQVKIPFCDSNNCPDFAYLGQRP